MEDVIKGDQEDEGQRTLRVKSSFRTETKRINTFKPDMNGEHVMNANRTLDTDCAKTAQTV